MSPESSPWSSPESRVQVGNSESQFFGASDTVGHQYQACRFEKQESNILCATTCDPIWGLDAASVAYERCSSSDCVLITATQAATAQYSSHLLQQEYTCTYMSYQASVCMGSLFYRVKFSASMKPKNDINPEDYICATAKQQQCSAYKLNTVVTYHLQQGQT